MKYYFIGDVHGCYTQLHQLILQLNPTHSDKIIFVGDYIDRGPQVKETLEYIKELSTTHDVVLLRGNHEDMFINGQDCWYWNGYESTIYAFDYESDLWDWAHWLENNTYFYYHDENIQAAHAGVRGNSIEDNTLDTLVWDRDAFKYYTYGGPLTIIGHTPIHWPALSNRQLSDIKVFKYNEEYDIPKTGLLNIDTGCVFHNRLTGLIMDFNTNKMQFVCVDNPKAEDDDEF